MTPTERLTNFLRERAADPVGQPPSGDELAPKLALARAGDAKVHALLSTLVDKHTSFYLFDWETYPAILLRAPRDEGVMSDRELCVAKNGAGDLYLWSVDDGRVRFVDHEEDWATGARYASFDAFLEDVLWSSLEFVEPDDLEDATPALLAKIELAIAIAGADALNDDAREKLVEMGIIAE